MNINPLSSGAINILSLGDKITSGSDKALGSEEPAGSFSNILTDALEAASQADKADKGSAIELLLGQSDDLSGLFLDMQKAELTLNLAIQIRNKVVEAYNEVMRMQV